MPAIAAFLLLSLMIACGSGSSTTTTPPPSLTLAHAAAHHSIKGGAAADSPYLSNNNYAAILGSEFSQLQAESEMKFSIIHPGIGTYDFSGGDALIAFAQAHSMAVWAYSGLPQPGSGLGHVGRLHLSPAFHNFA